MASEVHVGDAVTFKATVLDEENNIVDVSVATTKQIWLTQPDGTIVTKTASFYTDGTDGIIKYQCSSSDLSAAGVWSIQGYVILPVSLPYHTNIEMFKVYRNLQ